MHIIPHFKRTLRRGLVASADLLSAGRGTQKFCKLVYCQTLEDLLRRCNVKIALDVGANVGQYRNFLRNAVGFGGLVVSFEPVAALAANLKQCAASDPSWLVFDIALGSQDGIAEFNVMKATVFSSFRQPSHDHLIDEGNVIDRVEQVQVRRLDSVLGAIDPDAKSDIFLKLDTQGHELEVIKGISSFDRIRLIQSEMSLIPIYKETPSMADSIRLFQELGFDIAALCPVNTDNQHRVIEFDCLMVRSDRVAPSRIA